MPEQFEDEFEAQLHAAMRRVDAPAGFRSAVMQRVQVQQRRAKVIQMRVWSMAIAAVLLLAIGVGIGLEKRHRAQEEQARIAEQQFELAMQVTARSMDGAQRAMEKAAAVMEEGR